MFVKDGYLYTDTPYNKEFIKDLRTIKSRRWRDPYNIVKITQDKKDVNTCMKIMKKYFDLDPIEIPDVKFGIAKLVRNSTYPEAILFVTEYHEGFKNEVKSLKGRWNKPAIGWELPINNIPQIETVYSIVSKYDIEYDSNVETYLKNKYDRLYSAHEKKTELIEMSTKSDNAGIDGIKTPDGVTLYPYQQVGVNYIKTNPAPGILIADSCGLGKTAQALTYCYNSNEYPVLVVVPNSVKINWTREIKTFCNSDSFVLLSGRRPHKFNKADFVIINYDIISGWKKKLFEYGFKIIIMDEIHYIKNPSSKRSKACYEISRASSITKKIGLSATPLMNKPIELLPILKTLDVSHEDIETDYKFKSKYCYGGHSNGYCQWNGAQNLDELNIMLRETCMIRRLIDNVLTELPEKMRIPVSLDINNWNEYKFAENEFKEWYLSVKDKEIDYHAEALVKISQLRQLAIRGKIKNCIEYIENIIESNDKIIIFAHHRSVQEYVRKHFESKYRVAYITGGMTAKQRTENEDWFQNGDANIIVCSIQAANVGINLQASNIMIFLELDFVPSVITQSEGRCRRIGSTAEFCQYHYLVAGNTIEETMLGIINQKQKISDAAIDGINTEFNESIFDELLDSFQ